MANYGLFSYFRSGIQDGLYKNKYAGDIEIVDSQVLLGEKEMNSADIYVEKRKVYWHPGSTDRCEKNCKADKRLWVLEAVKFGKGIFGETRVLQLP